MTDCSGSRGSPPLKICSSGTNFTWIEGFSCSKAAMSGSYAACCWPNAPKVIVTTPPVSDAAVAAPPVLAVAAGGADSVLAGAPLVGVVPAAEGDEGEV